MSPRVPFLEHAPTHLSLSPTKRARCALDTPRPQSIPKIECTTKTPLTIPSDDDDDDDVVVFLEARTGSERSEFTDAQSLRSNARASPGSTIASDVVALTAPTPSTAMIASLSPLPAGGSEGPAIADTQD